MGVGWERPPLFKGTYRSKKIVRVAPDAFVRINGKIDLAQCVKCERSFDINPYVNSISIDLNIDSVPGSASISLSIPRHDINNFYGDGHFLITEMMEVEIFMKGYFNVYGVPQYYPVFWGLITQVSESYSSGEHSISLSCADILKWWEKTRLNVTPHLFEAGMTRAGYIPLLGNIFAGANPYDIIFSLSRNVTGDLFLGQRSLQSGPIDAFSQKGQMAVASIMKYWRERFARFKKSLVLYGINGANLRPSALYEAADKLEQKMATTKNKRLRSKLSKEYRRLASDALHKLKNEDTNKNFLDPTSPEIVGWKNMFTQAGQVNLWESEYMSKLEIANHIKDVINYEFFMDTTGDIVFKPPFWNLDVRGNYPISWIQDIDVIDWDFTSSESEVYTMLTMKGSYSSRSEYGIASEICPSCTVTDYKLLSKYGLRAHDYTSEWITSPKALFFHGLDVLDHANARRCTGSVTIPLRPELRMGFPIYIESRDEFWYVSGISHTISFGGRATTTLSLMQKRGKFIAPKDFATSVPELEKAKTTTYQNRSSDTPRDSKTGRIEGHKNIVMVYHKGAHEIPDKEFEAMLGGQTKTKKGKKVSSSVFAKHAKAIYNLSLEDMSKEDAMEFLHSWGNPGLGQYVYAQVKSDLAKQAGTVNIDLALDGRETDGKPRKNVKAKNELPARKKAVRLVFPVSDNYGYEHIGNYSYGRGLTLSGGGIREPSGGISLGQTETPDLSRFSDVINSRGLENFLTMSPSSDTDLESKQASRRDVGTQGVSTYTIDDPLTVEVDSVSKGVAYTNLNPIQEKETLCDCTLSRMELDFISLLSNREGEGDWQKVRGRASTKRGMSELLRDIFAEDDAHWDEHAKYEKDIRSSDK